ncbi:MAG: pseudouridine synthase [Mariprofundaceae bacterium]|nr:pseudouridine synthase [Mariprofundaceae bacterium]
MKQERLDRLLSRLGYGARRDVQAWIREGIISVQGKTATSVSQKVGASDVMLEGKPLDHPFGLTLIYHKPVGVVCSHKEGGPLIYDHFPERWALRRPQLSSVGRLDKDTSGLLILTDNGQLNHQITSPKHHISRTYAAELAEPLKGNELEIFAGGKLLLKEDDRPCLPAELSIIDPTHVSIVLHEGRYHQVRRMFAAVGNHVTSLNRSHIGALSLESTGLAPGEYMSVTSEEVLRMLTGETQKL